MALILSDRVRETTTTTGTGAFSLGGAATGYRAFSSVMANADTTYYTCAGQGTSEWEVGIGTWNTGNTLSRTTILASSNGGSAVTFSAGTKDIFITYTAAKVVIQDESNNVTISGDINIASRLKFKTAGAYSGGTYGLLGLDWGGAAGTYKDFAIYDYVNSRVMFAVYGSTRNADIPGSGIAGADFRAPIFYDSNNTAYYGDFASNSVFNNLGLGGVTPDLRLSVNGDSHISSILYLGGTAGSYNSWGSRTYTTSGAWYNNSSSVEFNNYGYGSTWTFTLGGGNAISSGSMRAPIFYDSGNTSYYLDGNVNSAWRIGTASGYLDIGPMNSSYCHFQTDRPNFYFAQQAQFDNNAIDYAGNWALYDGYGIHNSSFRAPIFYDSNDTNFYGDFASNSKLYTLEVNGANANASSDSTLYVSATSSNDWGITLWKPSWEYGIQYNLASTHTYGMRGLKNGAEYFRVGTDQGYHNASFRAPIFYDSDDTNYYGDFHSVSNVNALSATRIGVNSSGSSSNGHGISLYNGYTSGEPTYGLMFQGTGTFGTYGGVSGDWATYFTMNNSANRGWIYRNISTGNVASITNDGRMSIDSHFEQGNNFAHPNIEWSAASTSSGMVIFYLPGTTGNYGMVHMVFDIYEYDSPRITTVVVGGHNWSTSWYNVACNVVGFTDKSVRLGVKDGRFVVVFGTSGSSWSYGTIRLRKIHNGSFYNNVMDMVGNWSVTQTTTESFTYVSGDLRALRTPSTMTVDGILYGLSSVRSPIFYDYNDTNYYLDPTSSGTSLRTQGDWRSDSSAWSGEFAGKIQYHSSNWYFQYASQYVFRNSGGTNVAYGDTSGNSWSIASYRAPIFYDSDNTAYYGDFASSSVFSTVYIVGTIRNDSSVAIDDSFGLYFDSGGSSSYAIYRGPGAWTSPYPDLRIGFHTGIQIGAYSSYGGIRFYDNDDMVTQVMSVNNSADGAGGGNVYVNNSLVAGSSLRAPLFYDSNNTAYYGDFASTSNFNVLQLSNGKWYNTSNGSGNSIEIYARPDNNTTYVWRHIYGGTGTGYGVGVGGYGIYADHGPGNYSILFNSGGYVTAPYSFRSPIFYDSDNTGYYLDPASTSNLNQVNLQGFLRRNTSAAGYLEGNYPSSTDSNSSSCIYTIGGSYQPGTTSLGNMYGIGYTYGPGTANPGLGMSGWGLYVASGGTSRVFLDSDSGIGVTTGSWRAPIFYDRDNTAYSLDPASTSELNKAYFNSNIVFRNYGLGPVGLYASTRYQAVFAMGESYILPADGTTTGTLYGIAWSYPSAGGAAANLASHGMLILENGVFKGAWGGGSLRTPSDVRGTLFYDWDNTAYYCDPHSTSVINNVQITTLGVGTAASGTTGEIRATNNITAYYSDERLKTRLGLIDNALDKLLSLEGFYYEANEVAQALGYTPVREVGVSAQAVQKILPEVVVPAPIDDKYLTVRYEKLIPLLIEAIKELSAKVDELQKRN